MALWSSFLKASIQAQLNVVYDNLNTHIEVASKSVPWDVKVNPYQNNACYLSDNLNVSGLCRSLHPTRLIIVPFEPEQSLTAAIRVNYILS
eukprot:5264270-Amphidinium_carterae.1